MSKNAEPRVIIVIIIKTNKYTIKEQKGISRQSTLAKQNSRTQNLP